MSTFRNNKKKDLFSHKTGLVFVHGEVLKDGSRDSATFKEKLFAELVTTESCKGLHLMYDKVFGSAPDFYVTHHYMRSILTLNINKKNKQIFNKRRTKCLL